MSKDIEKAKLGAETFRGFCEQFGEDVYGRILLEVLLEGLFNAENLFVFGEQEQRWDQVNNNPPGHGDRELSCDESQGISIAPDLGTKNCQDNLRQSDAL